MSTPMTVEVSPNNLEHGMVLLGDKGGTSFIYDVEASNIMPGLMNVETEHGMLYLDKDFTVSVIA